MPRTSRSLLSAFLGVLALAWTTPAPAAGRPPSARVHAWRVVSARTSDGVDAASIRRLLNRARYGLASCDLGVAMPAQRVEIVMDVFSHRVRTRTSPAGTALDPLSTCVAALARTLALPPSVNGNPVTLVVASRPLS